MSISNGRLNFGLTSGLSPRQVRNLRLHVCGKTDAFAEATIDSTGRSYCWPAAGLDWSGLVGMPRVLHLTVRENQPATGAPSVSGTAQVGATVFASTAGIRDTDGLTNPDWEYRWIRVDADGSSNPEEISGETGDRYTLSADDAGKKILVEVSFADDDGIEETLTRLPSRWATARSRWRRRRRSRRGPLDGDPHGPGLRKRQSGLPLHRRRNVQLR